MILLAIFFIAGGIITSPVWVSWALWTIAKGKVRRWVDGATELDESIARVITEIKEAEQPDEPSHE